MFNRLRTFIKPPVFPGEEDKTRRAAYGHAIALIFSGIALVYELYVRLAIPNQKIGPTDIVLFTFVIVGAASRWLIRKGYVRFASILLLILIWTGTNGIAASGYGIRDTSFIINFVVMLIAALLLGWQATIFTAAISIMSGFGLAYAETRGLIVPTDYPILLFAQDISVALGLGAFFIYILITGLENAIQQSRKNLKDLEAANANLHLTQTELEAKTEELTVSNAELQKRTERLRAIAEVARTASSVQNLDALLDQITSVISKQLDYYHVGIFLIDGQKQYAILRSASSEGGQRMLTGGHRLKIGEQGMVGYVTYSGNPRVVLDVGGDKIFIPHPDLPETISEITLPLRLGREIIGALDMHSSKPADFSQDDVEIFTILADQVAVAIQNAESFEQSQRALREAETASSRLTGQSWKGYLEKIRVRGYRYDGIRPELLKETSKSTREEDALLVPVQLRGQTIGRLKLKTSDPARKLTEDEQSIIESTAERVALALESARLLDDAQKRAARETFLSEMGAKLGASFQLDSILRDTVEELGHSLKDSTVTFQLVNPSLPPALEEDNPMTGRNSE